jgi:hypothetical protein
VSNASKEKAKVKKKKKKIVRFVVDEETYEIFRGLIKREGFKRVGDFLKVFIQRYIECNQQGVTWVIDLKTGLVDREKLRQQLEYITKELAKYVGRYIGDILNQVINETERRLRERLGGMFYV